MRRLSTLFVFLLALATVGCDQSTKQFAIERLQQSPHVIFPGLQLTYTENRDMAFGLLEALLNEEARLWFLGITKSLVVLLGVGMFIRRRRFSSILERTGLALAIAGGAGNLIDRVRHGFVVDFLQVPYWPVFNVADVAVVVGAVLLFLALWRSERVELQQPPRAAGPP